MKSSAVSPVSPESVDETEMYECEYDVIDFLPTSDEWLAFIKCLAEDNVEELVIFSKLVNWENFLRSRDVNRKFLDCTPGFVSSVTMCDYKHPFPTNPFFVALFYDAKKCLQYMRESGVDFSAITEYEFTAYHTLMGAIAFISGQRFSTDTPDVDGLILLFHQTLFTQSQLGKMLKQKSCTGMNPLSWGVFLGLAKYVEFILYYYSPNFVVRSQAIGIAEHITLDVSMFVGENPNYFTCPLSVLLDLYGESTLPELKRLGIFRNGFIWKQWVDLLYNSNKLFIYFLLFLSLSLTALTVVFTGPHVNDYLKRVCAGNSAELPTGTIALLVLWIAITLYGISFGGFGLIRKEYHRRKCHYPNWPRQYYKDLMIWFLPNIVSFPVSIFLLWMYTDATRSCAIFSGFIFTISGLCNIILLLASVCIIVCYLRLVPFLTTLMSSFYNSISAFSMFIVFYLVITGIFARMFQSNAIFSTGVGNSTSSRPDTVAQFLKAFYQTFLVSLNIVDSTIFIPQDDRIDLNVTHIFYILFVPILFINFVVGILSSVVNQVLEHDIENRYILMLSTCDFCERTISLVRKLFKPRSLVIKVCVPLCPQSKLIKLTAGSIARPISRPIDGF